jgi:hypothetical protein
MRRHVQRTDTTGRLGKKGRKLEPKIHEKLERIQRGAKLARSSFDIQMSFFFLIYKREGGD